MLASGGGSLDPDERLRQGLRMIEMAYEERTRAAEQELQHLRAYSKERQNQVTVLETRVAELEQQVREADERTRQVSNEKAQLELHVKTMQRDVAKLDQFKRSIMQSIKDEEPLVGLSASTFNGPAEPLAPSYSVGLPGYGGPPPSYGGGGRAAFGAGPSYSPPMRSPMAAPQPAPSAEPGLNSYSGRCPPAAPPITPGYGEPDSAAPPAPPPEGGTAAHLDGKDFFRQARLRLTYEQFNQFLSNIKRLNDHQQSRDETLTQAQEIFGSENHDLFVSFKELLNKHGLT